MQTPFDRSARRRAVRFVLSIVLAFAAGPVPAAEKAPPNETIPLWNNEAWWGGAVQDGVFMPYGDAPYRFDLRPKIAGNQAVPLLVSSRGRYVWSPRAFAFRFQDRTLVIEQALGTIERGEGFKDLRGAFQAASERFFPPSGKMPDPLCFTAPQYNSWIEMQYEPSQEKVLSYARSILAHGMPPGVFMIDDNWFPNRDYGAWTYDPQRFPDPAAMARELHQLGFKLMLWVCPFIRPDSPAYQELVPLKALVRDAQGQPALRKWWNGTSAVLDMTNPQAVAWFQARLDTLTGKFGVDGFKLDAGDPEYYRTTDVTYAPTDPTGQCEAWGRVGLKYPLNEYRACWKLAGQGLVQRLRDKHHAWGRNGLADLIPNGLAQGLCGYAFNCPDLIGGGEISSFIKPGFKPDQELFLRTAQCSTLFPIMQFSIAPWRVLDEQHFAACLAMIALRKRLGPEIAALAQEAARTGEPLLRPLAYNYAENSFERIRDQFMLGENLLVAPVLEQGAVRRTIVFPPGRWTGDDGTQVTGPCTRAVEAPLARLPWYRRNP